MCGSATTLTGEGLDGSGGGGTVDNGAACVKPETSGGDGATPEPGEGCVEAGDCGRGGCKRAFLKRAQFSFASARALDKRVLDFLQLL